MMFGKPDPLQSQKISLPPISTPASPALGIGTVPVNPSPTIPIDPQTILTDVLEKYPRLKDTHDPATTFAVFASSDRAKKSYGNQLEYWPANEEGTADFPHPSPGNTVLEIYNDKLKTDPKVLGDAIFGDLLHGMNNDPKWSTLRQKFSEEFHTGVIEDGRKKEWERSRSLKIRCLHSRSFST